MEEKNPVFLICGTDASIGREFIRIGHIVGDPMLPILPEPKEFPTLEGQFLESLSKGHEMTFEILNSPSPDDLERLFGGVIMDEEAYERQKLYKNLTQMRLDVDAYLAHKEIKDQIQVFANSLGMAVQDVIVAIKDLQNSYERMLMEPIKIGLHQLGKDLINDLATKINFTKEHYHDEQNTRFKPTKKIQFLSKCKGFGKTPARSRSFCTRRTGTTNRRRD